MAFLPGAILIVSITGALAGPLWSTGSNQCATSCPENSKFFYTPGTTYEYDLDTNILTHVPGATQDTSTLRMRALTRVEVISQCEFALSISDSSLEDARGRVEKSNDYSRALEARSLRFAFIDGEVQSICPDTSEETWALNVKRGILSHLQNTMEDLNTDFVTDELDVSGTCPVKYTVTSGGVTKFKEVLSCKEDYSHQTVFHGIPYDTDSDMQNLPLLRSHHECKQLINSEGIITQSTCTEKHVFRPFSRENSGATTEVTSVLTFNRKVTGTTSQPTLGERKTLAFDFTPTQAELERGMSDAQGTLAELCKVSEEDIRPETPQLFTRLVRDMRKLDSGNLATLHEQSTIMCNKAEKFFRDAIPMLGSSASVEFIADMIVARQLVTGTEAEIWLTSQGFVARPTREMIQSAVKLMDAPGELKKKGTLAVSALVNNYCRIRADCENTDEVLAITNKLETELNYNCNGDRESVILALKAVGNTGHASRLAQTLTRCANNAELPMETRVIAVNAFRRLSCNVDRSDLMRLFSDATMDSELRINAYLQVMVCPSSMIIDQIRNVLENEEINQVGSFVWTHLTNLMETSSPLKQDISKIILEEKLRKTFDMDKRKFSRNIEWSLFSHLLNSGVAIEDNIIFSEKSFVPRSGMMNLTVDVFGHSMNLLEAGVRLEGFERILEDFFGPKKSERPATDGSLETFDRSFSSGVQENPKASYYMKIFGNELRYDDFYNINFAELKDKLNFLNWIIDLADEHEIELTKSMSFLDTTMTVPTSAGLPLKLSADGTFSMNLKVKGKLDMRRDVDIEGTLSPSGAVEITSDMGVDAFVARTGLSMVATMHTSTTIQGSIKKNDESFTFDFDTPRDKMEIFDLKTRFFVEDREQQMLTDNVVSGNKCWDVTKVLGMKLCGEYSLPLSMNMNGPMFPFTGPTTIAMTLDKTDTQTGYHMEATYMQRKEGGEVTDIARLAIGTPESKINRDLSVDMTFNRATWQLDVNTKSPWLDADFTTVTTNEPNQKGFSAVLKTDGKELTSIIMNMPIEQKPNGAEYSPSIDLALPNRQTTKLVSTIFVSPSRKVEWTVRMRNLPFYKQAIKTKGELSFIDNSKRWKTEATVSLNSGDFKGEIGGYIDNEYGNSIASRLDLSYAYKSAKERFTVNSKIRDQCTKTITQYSIDGQWTSTMFEKYNGDFKVDFSKGRSNLAVAVDAGFDETQRIKVTQDANWVIKNNAKKVNGLVRVEMPSKNVKYEVTLDHAHSKQNLKTDFTWDLGFHNGNFLADVNRESWSPLKVNGKVALQYPGRDLSWTQSVEEQDTGKYRTDLDIQLDTNTHVVVKGTYQRDPRHEITASVKYGNNQPMQFLAYLKPEPRDIQAHAEMTLSGKKYSVETTAKTTGDFNDFTTTGNFDLLWPERHITVDTSINSKGKVHDIKASTKWDADKDSSRQASFHTKLSTAAQNPQFFFRADCKTAYFVELDTNARHETGYWWTEVNDFQGVAKFKSSFPGWEKSVMKFKHDIKEDGFKTHFECSKNGDEISGDLVVTNQGMSNVQAQLNMQTPFRGWRSVEATGNYKLRARGLDADGKVTFDGQTISAVFGSQLNIKKHLVEVDLKVNTPYAGFEETTLFAKHNDDGSEFSTSLGGTWGNGQTLTYQQELTFIPGTMYNAKVKIVTPFEGMRRVMFTSDNGINNKVYLGKHELMVERRTWSLDTSLDYNLPTLKATVDYSCPLGNKIYINLDHKKNGQAYETRGELRYGAQSKQVTFENILEWAQTKKLSFTINCDVCPFVGTSGFVVQMDGGLDNFNGKLELTNTALMQDKILLTTSGKLNDLKDMQLNTNANYMDKSLEFQGTHKKQGRQFVTDMTFNVLGKQLKLHNDMTLRAFTNFMTSTSAEYDGQKAELDTKFRMNNGIQAEVSVSAGSHRMSADLDLQGNPTDFTGKLNTQYNNKKADATAKFQMTNGIQAEASLAAGSYRMSADLDLKGKPTDFTGKLNTEYNNKKADFTARFQMINGLDAAVTAAIGNMNLGANVKFTGELTNFNTAASFEIDGKKADAEVTFTLRPFSGMAKVTQEFTRNYRQWEVEIGHNGQLKEFSNHGQVIIDRSVYRIENSFSFTRRDMALSSKVIIPQGESYLTYGHSGTLSKWESTTEMSILGEKGDTKLNFDLGRDTLTMSGTVNTPFDAMRTMTANFNGNFNSWSNFKYDSEVKVNQKPITSSMEFKMFGDNLVLTSKFEPMGKKYALNVRHDGPSTNFKTVVAFISGYGKVKSTTSFNMEGRSIEAQTELETPFRDYQTSSLKLTHSGSLKKFDTQLTAANDQLGSNPTTVKINGDFRNMREGYSAEIMMNSEVDMIKNMGVKMETKLSTEVFSTGVSTWWKDQTSSIDMKLDRTNGMKGSVDIKTFLDALSNMGASFEMDQLRLPFSGNAKVYWNTNNVIETAVSLQKEPEVKLEITAKSPFQGYRNVMGVMTYTGTPDDFTNKYTITWDSNRITTDVHFTFTEKSIKAGIDVETPIRNFQKLGADIDIDYMFEPEHDIRANGKISWGPEITFTYTSEQKNEGKESACRLDITTPFEALSKFGYNKKMSIDFNEQTGMIKSLDGEASYYWNENGGFSTNLQFKHENAHVEGAASLTVYGMQPMGVKFNHDGPWNNMKTTGEVYWSQTGKIDGGLEFALSRSQTKGSAYLNLPIESAKNLEASFEHNGSWKSFTNNAEVGLNGQKITITNEFNLDGMSFKISSAATTPFEGYRSVSFMYDHTHPTLHDFKCNANVEMDGKTGTWMMEYNFGDKLKIAAELTTPFRKARQMKLEINHSAKKATNFQTDATFQLNNRKYTGATTFKFFGTTLLLDVDVNIPGYEKFSINANHKGKWNKFDNSLNLFLGDGKKITASTDFAILERSISANAGLTIPHCIGANSMTFTISGEPTEFNTALKVQGDKIGVYETTYKHQGTREKFECNFAVTTPYKSGTVDLTHEWNSESLNTEVKVVFDGENGGGSFSLGGKPKNFQGSVIFYGDRVGRYTAVLTHKGGKKNFGSSLVVTSPYKEGSIEITHEMSENSLKDELKVVYDGQNWGALLTHNGGLKNFESSLVVTTPYKDGSIEVAHRLSGNTLKSELKVIYDAENWGAVLDHNGDLKKFDSSLVVTTPYKSGSIEATHELSDNTLKSELKVVYDGQNWGASVNHNGRLNNFETTVTANTPSRDAKATLKHGGKWQKFQSNLDLECAGKKWSGMVKFEKDGYTVKTQVELDTPSNGKYVGSLNTMKSQDECTMEITTETPIRGLKKNSFKVTASQSAFTSLLSLGRDDYSFKTNWNLESVKKWNGNFELDTAFTSLKNVKGDVEFELSPSNMNFKSSMDTTVRGLEHFEADMKTFFSGKSVNWELTVQTPFSGFENWKAGMNHNGGLKSFETTGTLVTPLSALPSADLRVNHRGSLEDFRSSANYNGQTFDIEGSLSTKAITLKVTTPFNKVKSVEVAASHTDMRSGSIDFSVNGIQRLDLDFSLNETPMQLSLNVRQPRPFKTTINIEKQGNSFSVDADVDWKKQKVDAKFAFKNEASRYTTNKELTFETTLPSGRPVGFSTKFNIDGEKVIHTMEAQWNLGGNNKASYNVELTKANSRSQTIYDGKANIMTPWYNKEASVSHTISTGRQYTTQVVVEGENRLTISNEYLITAPTYKNTFTIQHPRLSRDISVVASSTLDPSSYNYEMSLQANMETEEFSMSGKLQDESRGYGTRYVTAFKASHPSTNLDVSFEGGVTKTDDKTEFKSEVKYMTSKDRQMKINSLTADVDHSRGSFNIQLVTPVKTMKLTGEPTVMDRSDKIFKYAIVGTCDGKQAKLELGANWRDKELTATAGIDDASMTATAKYENIKSMIFRVSHRRAAQNDEIDVIMSISPRGNRVVNTRSYVRDNVLKNLKGFIRRQVSLDFATRPLASFSRSMQEDVRYKKTYFQQRTVPVFKRVSEILIGEEATALVGDGLTYMGGIMETAGTKIYQAMEYAINWVAEITIIATQIAVDAIKSVADAMAEPMRQAMDTATQIPLYIHSKVVSMVDAVQQHPLVQKVAQLAPTEYYKKLQDTGRRYRRSLDELAQQYSSYMAVASDVWDNAARRTEVRDLSDYLNRAKLYGQWAYDHYQVEDHVKNLAQKASEITWDNMKERVKSSIGDMFEDSSVNEWNPESGNWDVDIGMPTRLPTVSMPDVDLKQYVVMVMEWFAALSQVMKQDRYTLMDFIYSYKPTSDVFNVIPPFKARASMSGDQDYLTFDKKFFPFAGECNYLLTRDFLDKEFAVMVNYETTGNRPTKKSLTVYSHGSNIEVFPDGRVVVDGTPTEAPVQIGNLTIQRENNMLKLDSGSGFKLDCNLANDHCTVMVSGWYYGKTGGLLGTYDNEPANDMMTVDRTISSDVSQFAATWAAGRRCRAENQAREQTAFPGNPTYDICAKFFLDPESPLRSGFKVVEPASYMTMCMNQMPIRRQSVDDACKSISLYITECREEGINIAPPVECVKCKKPDGTLFEEGTTITLTGAEVPRSADVVFVVEESTCNQELSGKLNDIAMGMKAALQEKGLTDNRFGIVGFGGEGACGEPNTHTMNGMTMSTMRDFRQGLTTLKFTGGNSGDAMKAIKFAANYPFRTGVSKTLVLMTCNRCEEKEVGYGEVASLLRDTDIKMHVMMDHQFELMSESKQAQTSFLYGHDEDGIFTYKNTKDNMDSDSAIFNHVIRPKDICAAAAISSQGSVFSTTQLTSARPAHQRRFIEVLTNAWTSGAQPTATQECECVADEANVGRSVCRNGERENFFMRLFNFSNNTPVNTERSASPPTQVEMTERQMRRLGKQQRQQRRLRKFKFTEE